MRFSDKRMKLFLCQVPIQGIRPGSGLAAVWATLIAVFADLVADEGARSGAPDGAHRSAKDGVAGHTADDGAYAGADLGSRGIGSATTECQGCRAGGREKDVTDVHGKSPLCMGNQAVKLSGECH
ncbi:hypothetical protein CLU85_1646 [Acidovorax sp. 69]|nr:hypothetical protein CLU85_1646 [Acidovorax sp. 69]